jgi:aspartyl-tRNA(Asn)/glutamyl-tRNA(Gln) amidotransferase subunit C
MQVEKEDVLHIAKLACLKLKEEEIEEYRKNLQDILNFANIVNGVNTENISETIGSTSNVNVFREDEVKTFEDEAALLQNAPEKQNNMFSIPKVI